MTLLEYARREDTPTNWMVRYLTGNMMKSFTTDEDLELAKKILEKKFYVLLTKELDMGLEMFLKDMKYKVSDDAKKCIKEEMSKLSEKKSIPEINVTSAAIRTLKDKNTLDTELFEFGVKLFTRQWTRRID
jgi:CRISPR/Cas system-associated endonuclease Cas1